MQFPLGNRRDIPGGSAPGRSRSCSLPRCVIPEGFPSIPGTDPAGRNLIVLLGPWQREPPWEKAHDASENDGGVGEGFGVGATPAKPSLFPGGGWPWLEMPPDERGLWTGRTMLAKTELERLDLSPNPVTLILIFRLSEAKTVYVPFLPLNLSLFLSFVSFFPFISLLSLRRLIFGGDRESPEPTAAGLEGDQEMRKTGKHLLG